MQRLFPRFDLLKIAIYCGALALLAAAIHWNL